MGSTAITESLASEYLRLIDEGWDPDLDEFLQRVPDKHREACRERIHELAALNGMDLDAREKKPLDELAHEIAPEIENDEPAAAEAGHETAEQVAEQAAPLSEEEALRHLAAQLEETEPVSFEEESRVRTQSAASELEAYSEEQAGMEALVSKMEEAPPVSVQSAADLLAAEAPAGEDVDVAPVEIQSATDELGGDGAYDDAELAAVDVQSAADLLAAEAPDTAEDVDVAPVEVQRNAENLAVIQEQLAHAGEEQAGVEELAHPEKLSHEEAMRMFAASEDTVADVPAPLVHEAFAAHDDEPAAGPADLFEPAAEAEYAEEPAAPVEEPVEPVRRDEPRYSAGTVGKPKKLKLKREKKPKARPQPEPEPVAQELSSELERDLQRHLREVGAWGRKGLIPEEESDRLSVLYRRLLDHEPATSMEDLTRSFLHILLFATATTAAVGSSLLVWFGAASLPSVAQWGLPAFVCLGLLGVGLWARFRKQDELGATVFFAAGALAALPAVMAAAAAFGFGGLGGSVQLFEDSVFANAHLLYGAVGGLLVSLGGLFLARRTVFAWLTAAFATAAYVSFWLTQNMLDLELHQAALRLLPLALLAAPARLCEIQGRVRWSLPFDIVALVALVGCVDAMALNGQLFGLLNLDGMLAASRQAYLGFTLSGVVLLAAMFLMERARSLALHSGARVLRVVAAIHVLASLYANAAANGAWRDVLVFLGAVAGLLVLGRWRNRHVFLISGLAGLVLCSYLILDLGLVSALGFTLVLGVGGLLATFGTYAYLQRAKAAAVGEIPDDWTVVEAIES